MNRLGIRLTIAALAVVLALPTPALATHMSQYRWTPTSHDDLGRSDEPNFGGATSILGPSVTDRNIDPTLSGSGVHFPPGLPGPGRTTVVAPGCTDDNGRQPSGLCGLWSIGAGNANVPGGQVVPAHTAGVQGMTGSAAPGRFTPSKATTVRFLDFRADFQLNPPAGGSIYFDYNHALGDTPVAPALAANGISNNALLPGGTALWAWFGDWTDKNGNGVIDAIGDQKGNLDPTNEFVWVGNCVQFNGQPAPAGQQYCKTLAQPVSMPVWIYPGDHHAYCLQAVLGPECGLIGAADIPGRNAVCFADDVGSIVTGPLIGSGPLDIAMYCGDGQISNLDDYAQDFGGDPLLGPANSVRVDQLAGDRTGDPAFTTRQWVFGNGWATYFYDQSLVTTTTTVAAVTTQVQRDTGIPQYFDLTKASYTDVDRYTSWSPVVDNLLNNNGGVKATSRSEYTFVRDNFIPVQKASDAVGNNRLLYDQCDNTYLNVCPGVPSVPAAEGKVDDTVFNAGVPNEPNTPLDSEPGATFAAKCAATSPDAFKGWCNDYSGYASAYHAWIDVRDVNGVYTNLAWSVPGANCILCVTSGPSGLPALPTGRTDPNNHAQSLQPGTHEFTGPAGVWKDRVQAHTKEVVIDVNALPSLKFKPFTYNVGPDGWVGDIVNTTGFLKSRGYGDETCAIGGVVAQHTYAECHPYADGNRNSPPQDYNSQLDTGGEFQPASAVSGGNTVVVPGGTAQLAVDVTPGSLNPGPSDCWNVPVLVWRAFDTWTIGDTAAIENFQGKCGSAARITMTLGRAGGTTKDMLILPEGNLGQTVYTYASATITAQPPTIGGVLPPQVVEPATDVDVYVPYGA